MSEKNRKKKKPYYLRSNKSDYKPTGNKAVDMVGAAISFYRYRGRLPEYIRLLPGYWIQFREYVKSNTPDIVVEDVIDFDDVKIVMGSKLQQGPLEIVHKQLKPFAQA